MILMRLAPYQDGGLRALLTPPPDCAAPCWLGVRPGVNTLTGSAQILQHSNWINRFQRISPATAFVHFSRAVPAVQRGTLNLWEGNQAVVTQLDLLDTGLSFSDIQLALGTPERLLLNRAFQYGVYGTNRLIAVYTRYNLTVTARFSACYVDPATFWNEAGKLTVTIGEWQNGATNPRAADSLFSVELDSARWATQLRQMQRCAR